MIFVLQQEDSQQDPEPQKPEDLDPIGLLEEGKAAVLAGDGLPLHDGKDQPTQGKGFQVVPAVLESRKQTELLVPSQIAPLADELGAGIR